jgi:hypothetical protein
LQKIWQSNLIKSWKGLIMSVLGKIFFRNNVSSEASPNVGISSGSGFSGQVLSSNPVDTPQPVLSGREAKKSNRKMKKSNSDEEFAKIKRKRVKENEEEVSPREENEEEVSPLAERPREQSTPRKRRSLDALVEQSRAWTVERDGSSKKLGLGSMDIGSGTLRTRSHRLDNFENVVNPVNIPIDNDDDEGDVIINIRQNVDQQNVDQLYNDRLANANPMREVLTLTAYSALGMTIGTSAVAHRCAPHTEMVHVPGVGRELPYGNYTATSSSGQLKEVHPCAAGGAAGAPFAATATIAAAGAVIAGVSFYNGYKFHKARQAKRKALIANNPGLQDFVRRKNVSDLKITTDQQLTTNQQLTPNLVAEYYGQTESWKDFAAANNISLK